MRGVARQSRRSEGKKVSLAFLAAVGGCGQSVCLSIPRIFGSFRPRHSFLFELSKNGLFAFYANISFLFLLLNRVDLLGPLRKMGKGEKVRCDFVMVLPRPAPRPPAHVVSHEIVCQFFSAPLTTTAHDQAGGYCTCSFPHKGGEGETTSFPAMRSLQKPFWGGDARYLTNEQNKYFRYQNQSYCNRALKNSKKAFPLLMFAKTAKFYFAPARKKRPVKFTGESHA